MYCFEDKVGERFRNVEVKGLIFAEGMPRER